MSDIPCCICNKEHDHRSGDHVCVGNLQEEIERLRANVHLAFYEGFSAASRHIDPDFAWDKSEAREALRAAP